MSKTVQHILQQITLLLYVWLSFRPTSPLSIPFTALITVFRASLSGIKGVSFFASSLLSFSRVLWVLYLVKSLSSGPDHLRTTYIFAARPIPTLMLTPRPASNLSQSCNGSTAVGEGSSFGDMTTSHDNI